MLPGVFIQPKKSLRIIYPKAIWDLEDSGKKVFLTFDDGPVTGITEWVLDELKKYQIKASFFCVGENILKYPEVFSRILQEEHTVGNHSFNHVKGFKTKAADYLKNIDECEKLTRSKLFRPPYGQLKPGQYKKLLVSGYKIVMWDVISYDYAKITPKVCLKKVTDNVKNGSIVLFHDNPKAEKNLKYALPKTIEHFLKLDYSFLPLPH